MNFQHIDLTQVYLSIEAIYNLDIQYISKTHDMRMSLTKIGRNLPYLPNLLQMFNQECCHSSWIGFSLPFLRLQDGGRRNRIWYSEPSHQGITQLP